MKKLRMIVTSVVVLAIVGSAFAFNSKKLLSICYSTAGTSTCNATLSGVKIDTDFGTTRHYYNGWDGTASKCTGTNCGFTQKFSADN